jgi:hypothetical protein
MDGSPRSDPGSVRLTDRLATEEGAIVTGTDSTGRMLSGRCECRAVRYRVPDAFSTPATATARTAAQGLARRSSRSRASSGTSSRSSRVPTRCSSGATRRTTTRVAGFATLFCTRSCAAADTCTSRWARSLTSRASALRSTSLWGRRRRGSRSPTSCRSPTSTRGRGRGGADALSRGVRAANSPLHHPARAPAR